jgi:hypothetical protein
MEGMNVLSVKRFYFINLNAFVIEDDFILRYLNVYELICIYSGSTGCGTEAGDVRTAQD